VRSVRRAGGAGGRREDRTIRGAGVARGRRALPRA
jgi:hypothetical protein